MIHRLAAFLRARAAASTLDDLVPSARRFLSRRHWLLVLGLTLLAYFGYHAINGSRGLLAWREVSRQLDAADEELAAVRAEREALEQKVRHLRLDSLDLDLLDEAARRSLSLVDPLDVIILVEPDEKAAP